MSTVAFVVIAVGVLAYGLVSQRLQRGVVTAPMVFVLFGLCISQSGLGLVEFHVEEGVIHLLAEVTLVLVLFNDAARIDLRRLRREHNLPVRMLSVGMPLTIVLGGALAGLLFESLTVFEGLCAPPLRCTRRRTRHSGCASPRCSSSSDR
jgi:NhaP-type Na+/H+ or K+/H+ antiporter